jgi:hypothetical protein
MTTETQRLKVKLMSLPADAILALTENEVELLKRENPHWNPVRGGDGIVRVSNWLGKPEATPLPPTHWPEGAEL